MLTWFYQEFFHPSPTNSPLPVMGIIEGTHVNNLSVGPVQAKLIEYFSRPEEDLEHLPITATWILDEFHKKHTTDGLSEEHIIQPRRQDVTQSEMFEEIINSFEDQSDSLAATCGKVKYVHPELRIGIIESSSLRRVHAAHQIRILKARAPVSLSSKELAVRIKKLLTHVDRFHCQLLVQFEDVGRVVSIPEAGTSVGMGNRGGKRGEHFL
ncbi:hypothetical protein PCASD_03227 [Puccinia coronata f. sp. avenae]|uniref:Uncharacterized protein n=1 Tax=Puccinia coronata f. sp. avenae TaxID=200324 RepID=A0A2N5RW99_9BASI|nr:hypothetical protein PCASD_24940 [Puccinia coronata f. sp. avenae]PLW24533.1 hypothetical protein PCASD_09211 [Puccinia coronata f. sp. avenae]PLW48734.1 hypothetical protein PCASD_03227 [Puccinia coronata f. sp. avenae]